MAITKNPAQKCLKKRPRNTHHKGSISQWFVTARSDGTRPRVRLEIDLGVPMVLDADVQDEDRGKTSPDPDDADANQEPTENDR